MLVEGLASAQIAQIRQNLFVCPGELRGGGIPQHCFGTLARERRYGRMLAQQVEVAEDRAAPKVERSLVEGAGPHRVLARVRVPAAPEEPAEHSGVKLIGIDRQLTARPNGGDEMPGAFGATAIRICPPATPDSPEHLVPPGKLVLLGDNSEWSHDSRQLGYFPAERLLGVVVRQLTPRG